MDNDVKVYKENLMKNIFYTEEEVSKEEYKKLDKDERYTLGSDLGEGEKYYKKIPLNIDDSELALLIQLKIYERLEQIDNKQSTIKNIMVFWLIITIIGLSIGVILINN
ncbi:hypothetical protein CPAST_c25680 [Clostridium pasteurianum DSM 525 = ATCC 6013]|uniref:Uncharacterized protein n=1 Tax=Clostridium pasteurianum DSM 525 = ATCC 6013 TaxID=1262449 RepID=A0A0H3J639_CLOPA|nr:hypothetical protein [Clostridium pasteurianum]AJA48637.1 hypothetical protein CPAST_c25680 [Clostridium pasteurianum DSM 525 = ATCC 6013]AJA52625.1 hypothetical protein CLPA_c25680 [Clostridium pasteurianum DSM 525 = ATCC 6013]AOZ75867.1 hypothetical protein AQ983_12480 [Clostridium pasteurianum DSM 525 = ATCC 6013]AOZ79663.1 hypothetical protein AQ984_12475 [Clostridium pasteurianum]ELP57882.1 hypothetical protein F502_16815 [Clostridium pasteurianum DSM 525 = ATCC 6013]